MNTHAPTDPAGNTTAGVTENPSTTTPAGSPLDAQLRAQFAVVAETVDRSNVAVDLEHLVVNRHPRTGNVMGAPRKLTFRAFLIIAILNSLRKKSPSIAQMTRTANLLTDDLLEDLGLKSPEAPRSKITKSQIGHLFNRLADSLETSQHVGGKRLKLTADGELIDEPRLKKIDTKYLQPELTAEQLEPKQPSRQLADRTDRVIDAEERRRRQRLIHELGDLLLQATVPNDLDIATVAVDWSDREAFARRGNKAKDDRAGVRSADPDARWGHRRPAGNSFTYSKTKKPRAARKPAADGIGLDSDGFEIDKDEMFFGYLPHFAVATIEIDGPDVPEIALSMRVTPANDMAGVGPALMDMLDSTRNVADINHAIIDRGYSMRGAKQIHGPAAERSIGLTFDLPKGQTDRNGTIHGAVRIAGDLYCPLMPRELEVETNSGPQSTREDWKGHHERREQRMQWAFRPKGRPTPDMAPQRYECPAAAGRLRCPLQETSLSLPQDGDRPEIYQHQIDEFEGHPPKCCKSKSLTVTKLDEHNEDEVRVGQQKKPGVPRQMHPFVSRDWLRSYNRRTASERFISHFKKLVETERDDIQMYGLVRNTLALTFSAVALNIRLLHFQEED